MWCKGFPEVKVYCERRGYGDIEKKYYNCKKGGDYKMPSQVCLEYKDCCTKVWDLNGTYTKVKLYELDIVL